MPSVTEVELAKVLGRDRMAIRKAAEKGRITRQPDGLFDLDRAVAEFKDNTHHEKGHNNRTGVKPKPANQETKGTGYAKARTETQIYEGQIKRLRYEERAGSLTPTADVENARFTEFRTLREACFNIPSRIAAIVAGESNVTRCQQLLENELTSVFSAFAEGKL